jgi:prolyl oligopeptidase
VADPYRWLERWDDPEVRAWTEAQNAYAHAQLDALPFMEALRARVKVVGADTHPRWSSVQHRRGKLFAIKQQPPREQPMLVVMRSADDLGSERIVVDPAAIDPSGKHLDRLLRAVSRGSRVAVCAVGRRHRARRYSRLRRRGGPPA